MNRLCVLLRLGLLSFSLVIVGGTVQIAMAHPDYDPVVADCFLRLTTRLEIARGIVNPPKLCKDVSKHLKRGEDNINRIAKHLDACLRLGKIYPPPLPPCKPGTVDLGRDLGEPIVCPGL